MNAIHRLFVTALLICTPFVASCGVEGEPEDDLDPSLEVFDDGKYDGPLVALDPDGEYRVEVRAVETSENYAAFPAQPNVFLTVGDARSTNCPSVTNCNFDLAKVPGRMNVSTTERVFTGAELRDGVDFTVHNTFDNGDGGFRDQISGLTKIKIGRTGSLRIRPFGKVKRIEFRIKF
jgi:hypothetical protein